MKNGNMYQVTKVTIVKDGKPIMSCYMEKDIKADRLENYRQRIKRRYVKVNQYMTSLMDEVQVDFQYKEIENESGK